MLRELFFYQLLLGIDTWRYNCVCQIQLSMVGNGMHGQRHESPIGKILAMQVLDVHLIKFYCTCKSLQREMQLFQSCNYVHTIVQYPGSCYNNINWCDWAMSVDLGRQLYWRFMHNFICSFFCHLLLFIRLYTIAEFLFLVCWLILSYLARNLIEIQLCIMI